MINVSLTTAKAILKLFFIIAVSYLACKRNILCEEDSKRLSGIICGFTYPFLMISCCFSDYNPTIARNFVLCIIVGLLFQIIIALFCSLFFKKGSLDFAVLRICSIYGNGGFVGIPLVQALYGSEGAFYMTGFIISFNLLLWTHGVITLQDNVSKREILNSFKSPNLIAICIGLILYFTRIPLPEFVSVPITMISNCNTPLSMVVAGIAIANSDILSCLKNKKLYSVCIIKQFLMPVISFVILKLLGCSNTVCTCMIIAAACPTAVFTAMNVDKYNKNAALAYGIFSVSTITCVLSIPLVLLFLH